MLTDQTIIAIRKGTSASTTEPFADSLAFARAVVEADRLQRMPDITEIRRVLACVKSSVDSGIPVTDGWRILDALLASTPAQPAQKPATSVPWMTARRAAYFMKRFLYEEKMLGPNEQDALRFTIEALEAMATTHQEPPQQVERKPMTEEQDLALCEAFCNAASDEYFKARPQLDSDVNRRIFYAGHRKAWLEWQTAHGIKE